MKIWKKGGCIMITQEQVGEIAQAHEVDDISATFERNPAGVISITVHDRYQNCSYSALINEVKNETVVISDVNEATDLEAVLVHYTGLKS